MTDAQATTPVPVDELGYEQARDELIDIVGALEQGSLTLEQSLRLWERGEALAARCEQWLKGARERLERVRAEAQSTSNGAEPGAASTSAVDSEQE